MLKVIFKITFLLMVSAFVFQACKKDKKNEEKTYVVTYDINGGTGSTPAPQSFTTSETPLTLNNGSGLTKLGCTFKGWATSVSSNTPVSSPYTPTGNVTLYTIWNPATYTITYDPSGGTGTAPAQQTFTTGGTALTLNDGTGLTKSGFTFGGWADKATSTTPLSSPYTPTVSITLYAIWNAVYTITYDLNGGAGTAPSSQLYTTGGPSVSLNDGTGLSKSGFAFGGWGESPTSTTPLSNSYAPTGRGNITLYAIWNAVYTITYDLNGGIGTVPSSQLYETGLPGITLNDGTGLTKHGFAFGGWSESATTTTPVYSPYTPTGNIILYVIWKTAYTITYDISGGTTGTAPSEQTYTIDGPGVTLNDGMGLALNGYVFGGWAEDLSAVAIPSPYTPTGDVILYPIWNTPSTATAGFTLSTASFTDGGVIHDKYGSLRGGTNISPQLSWAGAPTTDVAKYILVFFDASDRTFQFSREIERGVSSLAEGAIPGRTKTDTSPDKYYGPDPAGETWEHTYQFRLYAVKTGCTIATFGTQSQKHWHDLETENASFIVGQSNLLSGTYSGD